MAAEWVVPALDPGEDRGLRLLSGLERAPEQELFLERGVEALADGVVIAVALRAHRLRDPGLAQLLPEDQRDVLGGFNWSLQRSRLEGCDGKACGVDARVEGSGGGMRSPGAPSLRRDVERLFWREVAKGLTSEDAALAVGASEAAGSRWFRERGGVPTFVLVPLSGRYLFLRSAYRSR